jgi:hypothetical protein
LPPPAGLFGCNDGRGITYVAGQYLRDLQKNLACIDFSILLNGILTIADEVDSQLGQAMDSYMEESLLEVTPA